MHLMHEAFNINAAKRGCEILNIDNKAGVHFAGTCQIAALKMKQADRCVNQPLKERFLRPDKFSPEIFKNIVTRKKIACVEQPNPFGNSGV